MSLSEAERATIESVIQSDRVVLFMKGTRTQPQCGFSATIIGMLDVILSDYTTVNVLEHPEVREGIKTYSNWPTIPQLYIENEFMGGCDVVKQMFNTGALHEALGVEAPDRTAPTISLSDAAAQTIRNATEGNSEMSVHLSIDASWQHNFNLGPAEGHEIKASDNGVEILMDIATAQKAKGLSIDMTETLQGSGFSIDNPNAPPPVIQLSVRDLKDALDEGKEVHLYDVRPPLEREKASITGGRPMDEDGMTEIDALPRDAMLVFYCHTGQRSQGAAENYRLQGFGNVHNLAGGISAWSAEIDESVPRY
jgi:monothiol glutaredoxin